MLHKKVGNMHLPWPTTTQSIFLKYTLFIVFSTGVGILQNGVIVWINLKDQRFEIECYSTSGGNGVNGVLT